MLTDGQLPIEFLLQQVLSGDRFLRQTGLWYVGRRELLWDQEVHMAVAQIAQYDMVGEIRTEAKVLLRRHNKTMTIKTVEVLEDCLVEEECQIAAILRDLERTVVAPGVCLRAEVWWGCCWRGNCVSTRVEWVDQSVRRLGWAKNHAFPTPQPLHLHLRFAHLH